MVSSCSTLCYAQNGFQMTNSVYDLNFHAILTSIRIHLQAIKSHSPEESMFHKDCMINTVILTNKMQIHICASR